jgi:hypothetical protein
MAYCPLAAMCFSAVGSSRNRRRVVGGDSLPVSSARFQLAVAESGAPDARPAPLLDRVSRALACAVLVAFLLITFRLYDGASWPFVAFSLSGAFVVLLVQHITVSEVVGLICIAPLVEEVYVSSGGRTGGFPTAQLAVGLAFLGVAAVVLLSRRAIRDSRSLPAFLLAIAMPSAAIVLMILLRAAVSFNPYVYDTHALRFDHLLGVPILAFVGHLFVNCRPLFVAAAVAYNALPLLLLLVCVRYEVLNRPGPNPLRVFALAAVVGFVLYFLLPVTGPLHVFGREFFTLDPSAVPLSLLCPSSPAPRNGVPSLHLAWALLACWNLAPAGWSLRLAGALFLGLTALATLGFGEHYFVDLVVAVPFAVAMQLLYWRRWPAAALALAVTLLWMLFLRWGMVLLSPGPVPAWTAVLVSLAMVVLLRRRPERSPV